MNWQQQLTSKVMQYRSSIILILWGSSIGFTVLALGLVGYVVLVDRSLYPLVFELGHLTATASLLVLLLVLVPGIVRRLQVLTFLNGLLMPFRRYIGIWMYLLGLAHWLFNTVTPQLLSGNFQLPQRTFVWFGLFAFLTVTPLFLTSNDWSVRKLKRNWGKLHKLVYLVLLFVLLHVALQGELMQSLLAGTWLILEIASYSALWRRQKLAKQQAHK